MIGVNEWLGEGLYSLGWVLSESRGNSMIGHLTKSNL